MFSVLGMGTNEQSSSW